MSVFRDAVGQDHPRAGNDARVVSLVPSITELLFVLGLGERVVGRTGFCIHPRNAVRAVPKLGGTKDIDFDGLAALEPTHVIVNVDENTRPDYERLREMVPDVIVTHPNAPRDNLDLYRLIGGIFDRDAAAAALCDDFERAYRAITAHKRSARRVLYLIWRDPWMAVAADTYIARMLALVNWHVVELTDAARYPKLDHDELASCGADLILLSSEPYPFRDRHIAEVSDLARVPTALVDGEMLSWYGSRAVAGLDYLAALADEHAARAA